MAEMPGTGPTALIVVAADPGRLEEAAGRMAEELAVEHDMAVQILKGAPILFINGLTKTEVRALTPRLQKISEAGVEFRLTQSPSAQVAKVNWPIRPAFAPGGGPTAGVSIGWDRGTFSCPGCGETYAVRRLASADGVPAPAPAKAAALPTAEAEAEAPPPPAPSRVEGPADDTSLDAAVDMMADLGDEPPPEAPAPEPAAAPAAAPADDLGNLDDLLSSDQGDPLDLDAAFGTEAAGEEKPPEAAPAAEPAASPIEPSLDDLGGDDLISSMEGAEPPAAEAAAPPAEDEGGERFNVFIASLKDDKRQEVAKLISDFRKIPMDEAIKLTKRAMIKAADKVGKTAAEKLVNELKKIKISARMTKATG